MEYKNLYPNSFEEKIEFNKIKDILLNYCLGGNGAQYVNQIFFHSDFEWIDTELSRVSEMKAIYQSDKAINLDSVENPDSIFSKLKIEGTSLELTELNLLRHGLKEIAKILRYFKTKDYDTLYPVLFDEASKVVFHKLMLERIETILDKHGNIRDNASPELAQIRSDFVKKQNSINRKVNQILTTAQKEGIVESDTQLALRNGRLVIPVSASNKRKIKGFIHDESASGKTSFVEPAEVFEVNNELKELELAERREINKILNVITDFLRSYKEDIELLFEYLGKLDFLQAKARMAISLNAIKPKILQRPYLNWEKAIHPILFISQQKEKKKTVPLTITLNEDKRILVISGPNAGGKSVCLKTTGLLQYMLQCGFLVPMNENSESGIFQNLFIDIGDEQSIEDDLSTYSSHLTHNKYFIKFSNEKTLFLIDEFGTGTEPMLGSAIAESVLLNLNEKKAFGIVTTHYSQLKQLAAETDGLQNAAMLFDNQKMRPLFQLSIGKPGSSFAFEIARKIGLAEEILNHAREKVGDDQVKFDKLLRQVAKDKRYWENKRQNIRQKEKKLEGILEKYSSDKRSIAQEKKKILEQARNEAKQLLENANKEVENTIRKIKESHAEKSKTKSQREKLEHFKQQIQKKIEKDRNIDNKEIESIEREVKNLNKRFPSVKLSQLPKEKLIENIKRTYRIGDKVRLKGENTTGEIVEMNEKKWVIAFGNIMTTIDPEKVERISLKEYDRLNPEKKSEPQTMGWNLYEKTLKFKANLDVRGMKVNEAIPAVSEYIDEAIVIGTNKVKILHGTGNGVLRQYIRDYLQTVDMIESFKDEMIELGGSGITIVKFRKNSF